MPFVSKCKFFPFVDLAISSKKQYVHQLHIYSFFSVLLTPHQSASKIEILLSHFENRESAGLGHIVMTAATTRRQLAASRRAATMQEVLDIVAGAKSNRGQGSAASLTAERFNPSRPLHSGQPSER